MGDTTSIYELIKGGGVLAVIVLVAAAVAKGILRLGREDKATIQNLERIIADRDRTIERQDKEIVKLDADRARWIDVTLQNAPVIEKQKDAVVALTQAVQVQGRVIEELKDAVEGLSETTRGKAG